MLLALLGLSCRRCLLHRAREDGLQFRDAPLRRGSPQGDGLGTTPIPGAWTMAMVDNECPECAYGSLDLALEGNGRWKVEWYPVEVRVASADTFMPHACFSEVICGMLQDARAPPTNAN